MSQKLPSGFELHGIVWGPFTDVFLINYLHSFQVVLQIVSDTSLSFMKAVNFTRPGLRYSRFSSVKSCLSFLKVSASFLSFFSPDLRRKNRRYLSIFECFASTCYFPTLKPEWPFSSTSFRVHAFRFNRSLFSAWPHIYRRCS